MDSINHWNNIYSTKTSDQVSWTQDKPTTSLEFVKSAHLDKSASIIDIGGGDSKLVDYLLAEGFENLTVLDISEVALERAKKRLGEHAHKVNWIVIDINDFIPSENYDFWHDRAAFHFLTTESQIQQYLSIAKQAVRVDGFITIGTFSDNGPNKCSGLDIKQYSEETLSNTLEEGFEKIKCVTEDHTTPFNTKQHFLFCTFRRRLVS